MSYNKSYREKRNYPSYGQGSNGSWNQPPMKRFNNNRSINPNSKDFVLPEIRWESVNLEPFRKNFYKEHDKVKSMTQKEREKILKDREITVSQNAPNPISTFAESGLPPYLLSAIDGLGFKEPTPIQSQSWPIVLSGRDMVGIAETGSGKTLAFLVPSIVHINAQKPIQRGDGPVVLVIAPTRELALQIQGQIPAIANSSKIRYASIYGGVPKYEQSRALQEGVDIVVATPGRLLDFLSTKKTNLLRVTYLVLDEADRMLDMGFERPIRQILGQIRPDKQTLLFSATWPKEIKKLASEFLNDPISVNIGSLGISSCKNVVQNFEVVEEHNKLFKTLFFLKGIPSNDKVLVFVSTKDMSNQLCGMLIDNGFACASINGDKKQFEREQVLRSFKRGEINILIGTDVASRGIDIKDVMVVINFDFPNTIEDYVHRIGRTGRASATGKSYTLITKKNSGKIGDLIQLLKNDKKPVPADVERLYKTHGGYRPSIYKYRR